jgi:membrane protein YdbS with pleckstrin-like domain
MADVYVSKTFVGRKDDQVKKKDFEKSDEYLGQKKSADQIPFKERKSLSFSPFASFAFLPRGVDFETRNKDEKVVLLLRRHPITNLRWIFLAVLMAFAPVILGSFPILDFLPSNFKFVAILGWYLITIAFIFESFLNWFFNVNIVTDERIIDIDFVNLIYKEISDADIDKIQDVTVKVGGVLQTFLNYGDVYIQTASEKPRFEFLSVSKPEDIAKVLQELRNEEKQEELEGRVS